MNIKPIKTEADHKGALAEIRKLWEVEPNTPEGDKLEVLIMLVDAYEEKHHRIAPPNPVEAIKFRMDQDDLRRVDLARIVGGKNRATEVLAGKKMTRTMIENLHNKLGIPYESLFGPHDHINCVNAYRISMDTDRKRTVRREWFDRRREAA